MFSSRSSFIQVNYDHNYCPKLPLKALLFTLFGKVLIMQQVSSKAIAGSLYQQSSTILSTTSLSHAVPPTQRTLHAVVQPEEATNQPYLQIDYLAVNGWPQITASSFASINLRRVRVRAGKEGQDLAKAAVDNLCIFTQYYCIWLLTLYGKVDLCSTLECIFTCLKARM